MSLTKPIGANFDPGERIEQLVNRHRIHGTGTALKIFLMIASVVTACASAS